MTGTLIWRDGHELSETCRGCGIFSPMMHRVTVPHTQRDLGNVTYWQCAHCESLTATGDLRDYTDYDNSDYIWDHYVQIGAGIDFMVRPLERLGYRQGSSLLDVGCGYGFTLDYWSYATGGPAVGLEPSAYGSRGKIELGVDIRPNYTHEQSDITGRTFDRIISSEVIEHVPDPDAFLRSIKTYMAPNSALVITTPDAGFVEDTNALSTMLAVLSPGHHKVLFSQKALEALLRSQFRYVDVEVLGERLIAFASDSVLKVVEPSVEFRKRYIGYLQWRSIRSQPTTSLGLGIGYRLFKELVNEGRFEEAQLVGRAVVECVIAVYGLDLTSSASLSGTLGSFEGLAGYGRLAPYFAPCFAFYTAMIACHGRPLADCDVAALFKCAADMCSDAQRLASHYFQEAGALYWVAVFEAANTNLAQGQRAESIKLFEAVERGASAQEKHLAYCPRPAALLQRARIQRGVAHLQAGRPTRAMEALALALNDMDPAADVGLAKDAFSYWEMSASQARNMLPSWVQDSPKHRKRN